MQTSSFSMHTLEGTGEKLEEIAHLQPGVRVLDGVPGAPPRLYAIMLCQRRNPIVNAQADVGAMLTTGPFGGLRSYRARTTMICLLRYSSFE